MQDLCRAVEDRQMCRSKEGGVGSDEAVVFERRPSVYFMLDRDTLFLLGLAGHKLKPAQQERLYWNLLQLLNTLEQEGKGMHFLKI